MGKTKIHSCGGMIILGSVFTETDIPPEPAFTYSKSDTY